MNHRGTETQREHTRDTGRFSGAPRVHSIVLFSVSLCLCGSFNHALDAGDAATAWKAGVAKINITPEKLMWMSGYGARTKPAEGKLTELWAKALVLEDATGRRAVLVTLDLVGIDRNLSVEVCAE